MQEIRSSSPPVVIEICDPNKSRARHYRSSKSVTFLYILFVHVFITCEQMLLKGIKVNSR